MQFLIEILINIFIYIFLIKYNTDKGRNTTEKYLIWNMLDLENRFKFYLQMKNNMLQKNK